MVAVRLVGEEQLLGREGGCVTGWLHSRGLYIVDVVKRDSSTEEIALFVFGGGMMN